MIANRFVVSFMKVYSCNNAQRAQELKKSILESEGQLLRSATVRRPRVRHGIS